MANQVPAVPVLPAGTEIVYPAVVNLTDGNTYLEQSATQDNADGKGVPLSATALLTSTGLDRLKGVNGQALVTAPTVEMLLRQLVMLEASVLLALSQIVGTTVDPYGVLSALKIDSLLQ